MEVGINSTGVEQSLTVQVVDQEVYNSVVLDGDMQDYEIKFNAINEVVPNGPNYSVYQIPSGVLVDGNIPYDQRITGWFKN